jgi:hypothetical protein
MAVAATTGGLIVMGVGSAASAAGVEEVMVDKERLKTADMRITWRAVIERSEVYQKSWGGHHKY